MTYYRWTQKDKKMMQVVVDYFKEMLEEKDKDKFMQKCSMRICDFCGNAHKLLTKTPNVNNTKCTYCRIKRVFGKKCFEAFPIWDDFEYGSDAENKTLNQNKVALRKTIKELQEWGIK